MAAALADGLGERRLGAPELLHQPVIGLGLLQRRQILALQVLDERDLERLGIGKSTHDDRDLVHADALRRAPAPLAGNQLETGLLVPQRAHEEGLEDALFADRLRKRVELRLRKAAARLESAGADQLDRNAALRRRFRSAADFRLAEQCREAAAELAASRALAHRAGAPSRRSISAASRI